MKQHLRKISFVPNQVMILILISLVVLTIFPLNAQTSGKKISPNLFGLFFEDINYSADGGLYAELVQNRSFEYSAPAMSLTVIRIKVKK
jgi:alpha-L-arabinofuranosidase